MAGNAASPSMFCGVGATIPPPRVARVTLALLPPVQRRGFLYVATPPATARSTGGHGAELAGRRSCYVPLACGGTGRPAPRAARHSGCAVRRPWPPNLAPPGTPGKKPAVGPATA